MKSRGCETNSLNKKPAQPPVEILPSEGIPFADGKRISGHQFSAEVISIVIDLVLSGPVSQRAAASVLNLLSSWLGWENVRLPCANSGRLWMARVGLFALNCKKQAADDWLWMMDHTVQLGPWKCFVVVGIRLSDWRSLDRPLRHQDLSLLNLTPMKTANQEAVAEQLKRTTSEIGAPIAVLSDEGAELKGGMKLYREQLDSVRIKPPHLHDIKHKAATLLKKELQASDAWASFVQHLTRTKSCVILTELAFLNPPRLRNKARFMNLECVVKWGHRVLRFIQAPEDLPDQQIDRKKLELKLGWLREFEEELHEWAELLAVIEAAEKYVRRKGYQKQARGALKKILQPIAKQASSRRLMQRLLDFIKQESDKIKKGQRVLGHTEVLESLLGKYKQIQGRHSQGGMTASLLNIGAVTMKKNPQIIQQALASVPVQAVNEWVRSNLGQTVASKRMLALQ